MRRLAAVFGALGIIDLITLASPDAVEGIGVLGEPGEWGAPYSRIGAQ